MDLTGVVSDIFMCSWDKMLLEKMEESNIKAVVYKRYKDDVDFVLEVEGEEEETEVGGERSKRVMQKVKDLANTIHESIQVTVDCGYNYRDERLPILDVVVWVGAGEDGLVRILHCFYAKAVSSKLVMERRSAHG